MTVVDLINDLVIPAPSVFIFNIGEVCTQADLVFYFMNYKMYLLDMYETCEIM